MQTAKERREKKSGKPAADIHALRNELILQKNVAHNAGVANFIGVFGALVAGMVAGLWGVTGWIGFTYYLAMHAVVSTLLLVKCGFNTKAFFQSRRALFIGEMFNSTLLLTFILFWTLAHNYTHLF
ncbi:hypothetical protein WJX81_002297 [Elliptochloris bilobata]|uniref:ER membrane protein complex subunit 6 n=1 Tax=Elliptochloris bilobata TaxID=381761 RepID=A0AAW1R0N4_9CHLO